VNEAEALFSRFADRHQLAFRVDAKAPVELFWEFPAQERLTHPIVLGLQNNDELNFGVADFWSYFFPFPEHSDQFALILDAWVQGTARVVEYTWFRGRSIEVFKNGLWTKIYQANGYPFQGKRRRIISNITP
jgi:hypothetical protein